jgi:hypothetical protein
MPSLADVQAISLPLRDVPHHNYITVEQVSYYFSCTEHLPSSVRFQ